MQVLTAGALTDAAGSKQLRMSPYQGLISVFAAALLACVLVLGTVLQFLKWRDARRAQDTWSYFALEEDSEGEEYAEDAKILSQRSLEV
jgi:hypothetical protein